MLSVVALGQTLMRDGIQSTFTELGMTPVSETRNYAASICLEGGYSHLAMIDHDMTFKPSAFLRMLKSGHDVIACAAFKRESNVVNVKALPGTSPVPNGIWEVKEVGLAVSLITRNAIEALVPHVRKHDWKLPMLRGPFYGFFDTVIENTGLKGEDYGFCTKWRSIGGKIYAIMDEPIGHIGDSELKWPPA